MTIQFGCIRCKKTKRNEKIVEVAHKTMEEILQHTFNYLKNNAAKEGVEVPAEFHDKLLKWARKAQLIEQEPEPEEKKTKIDTAQE